MTVTYNKLFGGLEVLPISINAKAGIGVEGKIRKPTDKADTKTFAAGKAEASIGKSWGAGANIRFDAINFEWRNQ